jgi:P-loop containing NTP hydrolase pore-1
MCSATAPRTVCPKLGRQASRRAPRARLPGCGNVLPLHTVCSSGTCSTCPTRGTGPAASAWAEDPGESACHAQAVIELQRALPKARIMYVSATGATDPEVRHCTAFRRTPSCTSMVVLLYSIMRLLLHLWHFRECGTQHLLTACCRPAEPAVHDAPGAVGPLHRLPQPPGLRQAAQRARRRCGSLA